MLKYFPFLIYYSAVKDILIKSINEKIDFIQEKNDVVGGGSVKEQQLRTKLLINLSNALDEFITENHDDILGFVGYRRCLLYTSPSPRDKRQSRMPSSA